MTLAYLLDTNIVSEPLTKKPSKTVLGKLREHEGRLALAAPVWHELVFGCERLAKSKKRRLIEAYLSEVVGPSLPILAYDEAAAAWHGKERARLEKRGRPPTFVDGQIAAIAVTQNLVLVTANTRDFRRFEGLVVENWRR